MNMEISEDFSGSDHRKMAKGKRSKRPRPSSSTSSSRISTITDQEYEDMANCLILLASGGGGGALSPPPTAETLARANIYECKTCGRAFPSFQALGGHRASHKKPKPTPDTHRKTSPPPYEVVARALTRRREDKPRIHECSVCGSEFGSGQALGGHMRKHRSPNYSIIARTSDVSSGGKTRNLLEFDLNLLAEEPEDLRRAADSTHWWTASTEVGGLTFDQM